MESDPSIIILHTHFQSIPWSHHSYEKLWGVEKDEGPHFVGTVIKPRCVKCLTEALKSTNEYSDVVPP